MEETKAVCAHQKIVYVPVPRGPGKEFFRESWQCFDCKAEFQPKTTSDLWQLRFPIATMPRPNMTTAEAITKLRIAWADQIARSGCASGNQQWNSICDVLGFADRFKL